MLPYLLILLSISSYASASCGSSAPSGGDYGRFPSIYTISLVILAILTVGSDRGLTTLVNDTKVAVGLVLNSPKTDCDASCLYTFEFYGAPHNRKPS